MLRLAMPQQEAQTKSTTGESLLYAHRQIPCCLATEESGIVSQQHYLKLKKKNTTLLLHKMQSIIITVGWSLRLYVDGMFHNSLS